MILTEPQRRALEILYRCHQHGQGARRSNRTDWRPARTRNGEPAQPVGLVYWLVLANLTRAGLAVEDRTGAHLTQAGAHALLGHVAPAITAPLPIGSHG